MSTLRPARPLTERHEPAEDVVELRPGDHLDQPTFHRIYERMPEGFKAELIGGIVVVPLAVSATHGSGHNLLSIWLGLYHHSTPGTEAYTDTTVVLGPDSEPQPDGMLLILPEQDGQSRLDGEFVAGAPELVAEVAYASHSHDLHSKRRDYEQAGVREYVVLVERSKRVEWLALREGTFQPLPPGDDGVVRSEVFPGLWLDPSAMMGRDGSRVVAMLQQGLASPEHAAFVERLRGARRPEAP